MIINTDIDLMHVCSGFVLPKDICPYEDGKELYGKPRANKGFNKGLAEIEDQVLKKEVVEVCCLDIIK